MEETIKNPTILANRFKLGNKLGSGSFGEVYTATDSLTGLEVGVKLDLNVDENSQIPHEAKIMKLLSSGEGFPNMLMSGVNEQGKNFLAMDLLGHNLETLFARCGRKFTLKTVLMLADQMLKRIEVIHSKGFVYRDVKPDNFMLGKKGKQQQLVYLIDYGLVKRYKDPKTGQHCSYRDNKGLIGTSRYVSINTHLGIEQSRRDDLEGLAYVLIYFAKGRLPWQGLPGGDTKEEKYEKLKQKKLQISIETLCEGLPKQFASYVSYCRGLKFEEQPDYFYLKQLFKELFFELEYSWDNIFDWTFLAETSEIAQTKQESADEEDLNLKNARGSTNLDVGSLQKEDEQGENKKTLDADGIQRNNLKKENGSPLKGKQNKLQAETPGTSELSFQQILAKSLGDNKPAIGKQEEDKLSGQVEKISLNLFKPAFPKKINLDLGLFTESPNLFDSIVNTHKNE